MSLHLNLPCLGGGVLFSVRARASDNSIHVLHIAFFHKISSNQHSFDKINMFDCGIQTKHLPLVTLYGRWCSQWCNLRHRWWYSPSLQSNMVSLRSWGLVNHNEIKLEGGPRCWALTYKVKIRSINDMTYNFRIGGGSLAIFLVTTTLGWTLPVSITR